MRLIVGAFEICSPALSSAISLAATSKAGDSINSTAELSYESKDSTSLRTSSSSWHWSFKKVARCSAATFSAEWYSCSTRCQRSGSMTSASRELTQEPDFGEFPVTHHRIRRNLHHFCRFLDTQTSEES